MKPIYLKDSMGTCVEFTGRGELVGFTCDSGRWRLAKPAAGWSLTLVDESMEDVGANKFEALADSISAVVKESSPERVVVS